MMRAMRPVLGRGRVCALVAVMLLAAGAVAGLASGVASRNDADSSANHPRVDEPIAPELQTQSRLMGAIETLARKSDDPARTRGTLLQRIRFGSACYSADMTEQELQEMLARTEALPPTLGHMGMRFAVDTSQWIGNLSTGSSGQSARASLTYSFVNDGIGWGSSCSTLTPPAFPANANDLGAKLTTRFGSLDGGREYVRSALASWRRYIGVTYTEVADDGTPMDTSNTTGPVRSATRGDIRIAGFPMGTSGMPLAYNGFPKLTSSSGCSGGDMCINTSYFTAGAFNGTFLDAIYFRNTVAHEHGHGLGLLHQVPCNRAKLMEPFVGDWRTLLSTDDIRGGQRNYGDRYQGNQSFLTAHDLGDLTSPTLRSAIERDLSINGTNPAPTDDYFKFTLSSQQQVTITVTPTGETCAVGTTCSSGGANPSTDDTCCVGTQSSSCSGSVGIVRGTEAGNLGLFLYNGSQTLVAFSNTNAAGLAESISAMTLPAGTYYVRVMENGGQPASNLIVQLYDLVVRIPGTTAPPLAVAGLSKRATAGQLTQFIGNHNSAATEVGATLPSANFSWDFDGDGTFDQPGSGSSPTKPTTIYESNGVYNVKLRVTDSNGKAATDAITVTVTGALTTVTAVSPSTIGRGTSGAVLITGTNFKGVTSASQVTAMVGGGVTFSGTPVVNGRGTRITGLTMTVSAGATLGAQNITITNSDGAGASGTGVNAITVSEAAANDECAAPASWGSAVGSRPFTTSGSSTSAGQNCSTIYGDVWYAWTAPVSGALATLNESSYDVVLAVYPGLTCPPGTPAACSTSGSADVAIGVTAGQSYLFRIGTGIGGGGGAGSLHLDLVSSGACCLAAGGCSITQWNACAGTHQGLNTVCSPSPCSPEAVACCFTDGSCQLLASADCAAADGIAGANGSTCSPNTCPQPSGTCCRGSTCAVLTSAACTAPSGIGVVFVSSSAACNTGGSTTTPCCLANFDKSAGVAIDDIFSFLNAWFSGSVYADITENGAATPDINDIFVFLNAWFAGCP